MKRLHLSTRLILALLISTITFSTAIFADETTDIAPECKPADQAVYYDKFQSDSVQLRDVQIWYQYGQDNFKLEDWQKAIGYYWKVVLNDKAGTYKVVYRKLADSYLSLMKINQEQQAAYLDSAFLAIYRGLDRYPDYAMLHFKAGNIYKSMQQPQCAIPHYEALTGISPKQVNYQKILAQLLYQTDDERALTVQGKVLELSPEDTDAAQFHLRLLSHFNKDALAFMAEQFERDTSNVINAMRYGKEAYNRGEYAAAKRAFNAAFVTDSSHLEAAGMYARSCEGLGDYRSAISQYQRILEANSGDINTLSLLALATAEVHNFSAASGYARKAIRISPESGQPFIVLGHIYEKGADYFHGKSGKNNYSYDTKMVMEKAAFMYKKAQQDPNWASQGVQNYERLSSSSVFRNKEDKHLHNYRENITDPNYSWVK